MAIKLSTSRTGRALLSRSNFILRLEGLCNSEKYIHLIGFRIRDFLACSVVPEPLRYRVPPRET
jgi:hypothetical protein